MGLFDGKIDCHTCGKEVEKKSAEKRFGEYFCDKKEAEKYVEQVNNQKAKGPSKGSNSGCC